MSNATLGTETKAPTAIIPLYTTPDLQEYYNKQVDQKFQEKGKNAEKVDGHEVYFKPISISQKFNKEGPFVEVLTDIFDSTGKNLGKFYPYGIYFTVEKGYTIPPRPGDEKAVFVSLGTSLWPADKFCKVMERFDD